MSYEEEDTCSVYVYTLIAFHERVHHPFVARQHEFV
jgi:hypothetical protein